jgi:hypothetical protein
MTETQLDKAHSEMDENPESDAARLQFYERLADSELFILLEGEAQSDQVRPQVFPVEDQNFVLLFDREERLTRFANGPANYAGMSGRKAVEMLAGQGLGIGLNLEVAPSSMLLPANAVGWLASTLAGRAQEIDDRPEEITAPVGFPKAVLTALDTKLAMAAGFAKIAYLSGVTYQSGRRGHLLSFIDTQNGAELALAAAVREALVFSGIDAGELDVAFFRSSEPMAAVLARHGLRFDLPDPARTGSAPSMPGMNPDRPPILR